MTSQVVMKAIVRVKPGSKRGSLVQPALEGKANKAVIELLADYYDVPKTSVRLTGGHKSKIKKFQIIK